MNLYKSLNLFISCLVKFRCYTMPHFISANRGLSIISAVWPILKTQGFAERHCWQCACRDTVRIGKMPTQVMTASCHTARAPG